MSSQLPAQNRSGRSPHQVSQASAFTVNSSSSPTRSGSPILINSRSEGLPTAEDHALLWTGEESKPRHVILIDALPDDALLVIFDYYVDGVRHGGITRNVGIAWRILAHVCRRWRSLVFQSPRRLDLRLFCTGRTPARDKLDVWPNLPLIVEVIFSESIRSMDNIIAVLERTDRVCQINLSEVSSLEMDIFLGAMQQPFPELTNLRLRSKDEKVPVVPDSFLGGSAPRLEVLAFGRIPFPGLPKLLLSATRLKQLSLFNTPHSGYISPDVIATVLPTLTSLIYFELEFISTRSCPDWESRRPHPSTRPVLPVLTLFWFKGVSEYLEDLVVRIDCPKLKTLLITFFNDIVFETPQLIQFISRTPNLKAPERADIDLPDSAAKVKFSSRPSATRDGGYLSLGVSCKGLDWQLSSLEQVCTSCLPPFSSLESLYFSDYKVLHADWQDNIDNEIWVELLRSFSTVKNLYLAEKFVSPVASALQKLVEGRTATVLPTLHDIFVRGLESSGSVEKGIRVFVAARQVAGHPITVSRWG